ncbi:MAG: hypothetical protein HYR78_08220 [Nitrospirae bacterium]|nr:hypothetical protein [Nitrospirota bacterium]
MALFGLTCALCFLYTSYMDLGTIVEAILKIGLAPTLLVLVLYWYKESMDKRIKHLEDENKKLLELIEKNIFNSPTGGRK